MSSDDAVQKESHQWKRYVLPKVVFFNQTRFSQLAAPPAAASLFFHRHVLGRRSRVERVERFARRAR